MTSPDAHRPLDPDERERLDAGHALVTALYHLPVGEFWTQPLMTTDRARSFTHAYIRACDAYALVKNDPKKRYREMRASEGLEAIRYVDKDEFEQAQEPDRKVYIDTSDGTCTIATGAGWYPGIYADEAAANLAFEFDPAELEPLCESRGRGDDYKPIRVEDLQELRRKATAA